MNLSVFEEICSLRFRPLVKSRFSPQSQIFAHLHSLSEGFLSLLERALTSGRPVLTTQVCLRRRVFETRAIWFDVHD